MSSISPPDYKALFLRAEEERQRKQVESPSRSTTGTVPAPKGKRCPLQLLPWTECTAIQQEIYHSVCTYLAPPGQPAAQLFPSRTVLKGLGEEFKKRAISSEQDLQSYERFGVENHVRDIIAELCKIRAAREEFQLGNGIQFDNHANALNAIDTDRTPIMTVEYKPPHKLSVEDLRAGLRPMQFWNEVVRLDSVPTEGPENLRYNAAWLTGSVVVQEYHVVSSTHV
ncbi:hypothetical protein ASPFODRAFT_66016 [Aspergillus luchuensis CBS 106.47]|uniref:Uncharacterized protein n=1 Tax=Aspergillus luchuensis (strain CBS 106.47) TaxID=1137211 RepID=A0A1M3SZB2_ASPLC|nr:hypothetical protein ASPFODRAFT_66016 [Aspergillus luchuensis CBS 106.47]